MDKDCYDVLEDIYLQTSDRNKKANIVCVDGAKFSGYFLCWTETEYGDDDDAIAMLFRETNGREFVLAGAEIESYEIVPV